jgi:hypothetical protein
MGFFNFAKNMATSGSGGRLALGLGLGAVGGGLYGAFSDTGATVEQGLGNMFSGASLGMGIAGMASLAPSFFKFGAKTAFRFPWQATKMSYTLGKTAAWTRPGVALGALGIGSAAYVGYNMMGDAAFDMAANMQQSRGVARAEYNLDQNIAQYEEMEGMSLAPAPMSSLGPSGRFLNSTNGLTLGLHRRRHG